MRTIIISLCFAVLASCGDNNPPGPGDDGGFQADAGTEAARLCRFYTQKYQAYADHCGADGAALATAERSRITAGRDCDAVVYVDAPALLDHCLPELESILLTCQTAADFTTGADATSCGAVDWGLP